MMTYWYLAHGLLGALVVSQTSGTDSTPAWTALALGVIVFIVLAGVGSIILWMWALIHALCNDHLDSTMKLVWVLIFLCTSILGSVLYIFLKPKKCRDITS